MDFNSGDAGMGWGAGSRVIVNGGIFLLMKIAKSLYRILQCICIHISRNVNTVSNYIMNSYTKANIISVRTNRKEKYFFRHNDFESNTYYSLAM
jgi:hypothetical protein